MYQALNVVIASLQYNPVLIQFAFAATGCRLKHSRVHNQQVIFPRTMID